MKLSVRRHFSIALIAAFLGISGSIVNPGNAAPNAASPPDGFTDNVKFFTLPKDIK